MCEASDRASNRQSRDERASDKSCTKVRVGKKSGLGGRGRFGATTVRILQIGTAGTEKKVRFF